MAKQPHPPGAQALALGMANMAIFAAMLDALVRRNLLTADDAKDMASRARKILESAGGQVADDRVYELAAESLQILDRFLVLAAIGKPLLDKPV